jgi:endonuclease/exonuclease/phosphatase family metal-dependent hydrolase
MIQITVSTINLRKRADRWSERRHLLVMQLLDAAPELISLQEIDMPSQQGRWLCKQINVRLTGSEKRPYSLVQRRKRHLINGYFEGVGVLSRLPVLYSDSLGLGYGGQVALRVHVQLPSHQTMDIVSTQLHDVQVDREARLEQAMQLISWMRRYKHVPLQIITGDLGEPPNGRAVQFIKQSFRSAYEEKHGHEPLATFPTAMVADVAQAQCRDYILVSKGVRRATAVSIFCDQPDKSDPTLYPSEHVGLMATLEV